MDNIKKFEDFLDRIQGLLDNAKKQGHIIVRVEDLENAFPELKESKVENVDEKVRKALIKLVTNHASMNLFIEYDIHLDEALAWLEKQGEKSKKVSIWKHWKDGIAGNGEGKPIYLIKDGYTYSISSCLGFECDYIELSELDKLLSEKHGEQKPAWREEDENAIQVLKDIVKHSNEINENIYTKSLKEKLYDFLKSIKERVLPQPKQEWSEENKEQLDRALYMMEQLDMTKSWDDVYNWLKSLRHKNTWKPSDEQIDVLEHFVRSIGESGYASPYDNNTKLLYLLLEQLRKLREE